MIFWHLVAHKELHLKSWALVILKYCSHLLWRFLVVFRQNWQWRGIWFLGDKRFLNYDTFFGFLMIASFFLMIDGFHSKKQVICNLWVNTSHIKIAPNNSGFCLNSWVPLLHDKTTEVISFLVKFQTIFVLILPAFGSYHETETRMRFFLLSKNVCS